MNNEFENNNIPEEEISSASEVEVTDIPCDNEENSISENPQVFSDFDEEDQNKEEASSETLQEEYVPVTKVPEFNVTHKVTKKEKKKWPLVVGLSLIAGIVLGTAFSISSNVATRIFLSKVTVPATEKVSLNKDKESAVAGKGEIAKIVEECMPSVVAITNRGVEDVMTFFGAYKQESTSTGSGIIIGKNDTELLIVTNYHVVANAKELSVVFSSVESKLELQAMSDLSGENVANKEYIPTATVKGYNSDKDLAVIAVKLEDIKEDIISQIKIATIGDSSKLKPGDQVVAIGNALGYGQSVTTGIISAVNRKITMESSAGKSNVTNSFIQTDAAINSGNSGGALLDMEGRLVGINSVKIATTGVEGMGYSIPITDVESIIDELMVRKTRAMVDEKEQGFLGITGTDVSSDAAQIYGIPAGVFVNSVIEGLAAEKAGIMKGYVISEFDGFAITSMAQLQDRLKYYKAGEVIKIKVQAPNQNGYKEKELEIKLSKRPQE